MQQKEGFARNPLFLLVFTEVKEKRVILHDDTLKSDGKNVQEIFMAGVYGVGHGGEFGDGFRVCSAVGGFAM